MPTTRSKAPIASKSSGAGSTGAASPAAKARSATQEKAGSNGAEARSSHGPSKTAAAEVSGSTGSAGRGAPEGHASTPAKAPAAPAAKASGGRHTGLGLRSGAPPPARKSVDGYTKDEKFLVAQRAALLEERATYLEQAASLKAEAEALVEEMEPGDIQFDDESGEGGTVTVDRERDLALSAQALATVEEIDHALAKMAGGTYGVCENCGRLIPKPRLDALPYARLCIDCKSGGLSRR